MLVRRKRGWELPESAATPEHVYLNRRRFMGTAGSGALAIASGLVWPGTGIAQDGGSARPTADLYPVPRNMRYRVERDLTSEELATTYNNFYEFGSHKEIWRAAQALPIRPWTVTFDGQVEEERTVDIDTLIRAMSLEERVYRLRCVEAWAITIPWSGFPMRALIDYARPLSSARYVRMETFQDSEVAPGQRQFWYPWPYVEGLTMAEARNDLAFMVTGLYGRPLPKQNGAPLRLAVPWKYGFKSLKSIVRLTFTEERPVNFWQEIAPNEYGFWANVNPEVPHPRWSQATERLIGTDERVPTRIYNGYGEFVADLYADMQGEPLFM
ncbi:MAG: protein-methionine-sulfoxide reductase catalytic subunit MsrP [Alphaproteobacteria bacterium]|jgi:sulfoxide reductase catalytic subunit YedY|nr:protein-methionine-sulfoxide reductase catalytic subunit MsrP [Alphaproteobacteria bacterium]